MALRLGPLTISRSSERGELRRSVFDLEDIEQAAAADPFIVTARENLIQQEGGNEQIRVGPASGGSGERFFTGVGALAEGIPPELQGIRGINTFDRMRLDGQVSALLWAFTLPLVEATWDIEPASEEPEDIEVAQWWRDEIFGGLDAPWPVKLREILSAYWAGFSFFEIVPRVGDDMKVHVRLPFRPPRTIWNWNTDPDTGDLKSVTQRVWKNNTWQNPEIIGPNILLYSMNREGNNYPGRSILMAAWKHWRMKDDFYNISGISGERNAMGVPYAQYPPGTPREDVSAMVQILSAIRTHSRNNVVIPTTWEWGLKGVEGSIKDVMPDIDHHSRMITHSVIAGFLDLDKGDAQSHSHDLSSLFLMALHGIGEFIADTTTRDLIKPVSDLNWRGLTRYPKMTVSNLDRRDVGSALVGLAAVITAGGITPDPELEGNLRDALGVPPLKLIPGFGPDEINDNPDAAGDQPADATGNPTQPPTAPRAPTALRPPPAAAAASDRQRYDAYAETRRVLAAGTVASTLPVPAMSGGYRRELTALERNADLPSFERHLDNGKSDLLRAAEGTLHTYATSAARKAKDAVERGEHINPARVRLDPQHLADVISAAMKDAFAAGRETLNAEARRQGVTVPPEEAQNADPIWTRDDLRAIIAHFNARAESMAAVITARMGATLALFAGRQIGDATFNRNAIEQALLTAAKLDLVRNAGSVIHDAFSAGRAVQARRLSAETAQYSALLDKDTCEPCELHDGESYDVGSGAYDDAMPPLQECEGQDNCRCVYVYDFSS